MRVCRWGLQDAWATRLQFGRWQCWYCVISAGVKMRNFLKIIAPKAWGDGLVKTNELGKSLVQMFNVNRMLDVGCGAGELTLEFAEVAASREIHGIEYVEEMKQHAQERGIICTQLDMNSCWPFPDNHFEIILSSQSIEHVHNTRLYLEECYRCLVPGGQLLVLTENLASWVNIGALFFGWQPFSTTNINGWSLGNPLIWHKDIPREEFFGFDLEPYQETGISGTVGHVRVLAYKGLFDLLKKVGFRQVEMHSRGYLPFWGSLSDFFCTIDKRHGNFLIATGFK